MSPTPSSRRIHGANIASMACSALQLISTQRATDGEPRALHGDASVKFRAGQFRRQGRLDARGRDGDRRADTRQRPRNARRRREGGTVEITRAKRCMESLQG